MTELVVIPLEMRVSAWISPRLWVSALLMASSLYVVHGIHLIVVGAPVRWWDELGLCLFVAYLATMGRYWARCVFRWFQAAGLVDGHTDLVENDMPALMRPLELVRRSRRWGLVGAASAVLLLEGITLAANQDPLALWELRRGTVYSGLLVLLSGWLGGRAAFFAMADPTRRIERIALDGTLDLLDLRRVKAVGSYALHGALIWIIGASLIMLPAFDTPKLETFAAFGLVYAVVVTIGLVGTLASLRNVRLRLSALKKSELALVDAAIRGDDGAACQTRLARGHPSPSVADLIAYRSLVVDVREWPLDAPRLTRFGLYTLIPLASWTGGALVERLIDSLVPPSGP